MEVSLAVVESYLTSVVIFLVLLWFISALLPGGYFRDPKGIPPGPWRLPLIGHAGIVDYKAPHESFTLWGKKYGGIYKVYMGTHMLVIINDYELLKEAFTGKNAEIFSGRPNSYLFNIVVGSRLGIINNDGDFWREHRRFAMSALKDLGLGKSVMEERITSNCQDMIAAVDKLIETEDTIDIDFQLKICLCNIISSLLIGYKFNRDDPVFHDLAHRLGDLVRVFGECQVLNYIPFLQYLLPSILPLKQIKDHINVLREKFMRMKIFEQRDSERNTTDLITNICQAYIRKMDLKLGKSDMYDYQQLEAVVYDLYTAGQEASINTIGWGLIFLLHNPEVQEKIQAELDEKVGRIPTWADKAKLPYTWASVLETQRLGSIVPLGVPHSNHEDVHIGGYFIPKGTVVISNFVAMHRDEKYFPDPMQFKPERFIDSTTGLVKENLDSLVPFSIGKRSCVGENMAKMELFLLWSAILYRYRISVPKGEKPPSRDVIYGATLAYKPFKVTMVRRELKED